MNIRFTEKRKCRQIIMSSVIVLGIVCTLTLTYERPVLACEGEAHPGHHIVMKMIDPASGDLYATITFDKVVSGGKAKMTEVHQGLPSPSTYELPAKPAYYDIKTSADYAGNVEVCVNYKAIGLKRTSALRVAHLTNGAWEELKTNVDRGKELVCGVAPSLSHFVVYEDPRYRYGPVLWYQHF